MNRREHKFFNLSFLDVLCGALGAILFLFISVDKGGVPPPSGPAQERPVAYLSMDTTMYQLHGLLPDSLAGLRSGDSVTIVINAVEPMPTAPKCPECVQRKCPECSKQSCPDPARHKKPDCPDPTAHRPQPPVAGQKCPDPLHHQKVLCESTDCKKGREVIYKGDPVALAYKLGFSLTASNEKDEIDLQVCFEGRDCAYGGRKKGRFLRWIDLKDGFWGKPRAWNEIIVAENSFEAGTYTCYARVSCKTTANTQVELVAATKKDNTPTETATFNKTINCGNEWVEVGKVVVGANYSIKQK